MYVERTAQEILVNRIQPGKVVVLVGARRVGKTVLLQEFVKKWKGNYLFWNGEDFAVQEMLQRRTAQHYHHILGKADLLVIDEAQHIPQIGRIMKLMVDSFPHLKIIITGSSAFDITDRTGEPLTGRKSTVKLFPLSEQELILDTLPQDRLDNLRHRLVYGNLPELLSIDTLTEKAGYLRELVNSYLMKDILTFERIRNAGNLFNLLKLIAFQVGSEVSLEELGCQLSMSKNTVERYLNLLTKIFVLYPLSGFSRNLRKEVTKSSKWYFFDNGIRNAIIANFASLEQRNDVGFLWENYLISERLKFQHYSGLVANNYFWRTYDRQEIDWIEDCDGRLTAYEFKWRPMSVKTPVAWSGAYPDAQFHVISQDNFGLFVGLEPEV